MASVIRNKSCVKCSKSVGQVICGGCEQCFCFKHLNEHRQELNRQMDEITMQHDQLQQNLSVDDHDRQHPLMARINRWEQESIQRIKEVANNVRLQFKDSLVRSKENITKSLRRITVELQHSRAAEEFTEIDLNKWMRQLKELRKGLNKPPMLEITNDDGGRSSNHLALIRLRLIENKRVPSLISSRTKWSMNGVTVAGGHEQGHALNQLHCPSSFDIDDDRTLFIADTYNHRVMRWKPNAREGEMIVGAKGRGNRTDQLDGPSKVLIDRINDCLIISEERNRRVMRWSLDKIQRNAAEGEVIISNIVSGGLAMDEEGSLYVSDCEKDEVRRYRLRDGEEGVIVAGGNGQGSALNQLNCPRNIFVADDHSVYVSDGENHRVMKWMKNAREGIIVAGGQGEGKSLQQLSYPDGIFVDRMGSVYVADQWNDRVMRWLPNVKEREVIIGGNRRGSERDQMNRPSSIALDHRGNFYVADRDNHRIRRFVVE